MAPSRDPRARVSLDRARPRTLAEPPARSRGRAPPAARGLARALPPTLFALLALPTPGCARGGGVETRRAGADLAANIGARAGTFTHALHLDAERVEASLGCRDCHDVDLSGGYRTVRPGSASHAPCDRCHEEAFREPPGPLCRNCHVRVNPLVEGDNEMYGYPSRRRVAALVSRYNHAVHLAAEDPEGGGAGLGCEDCHAVTRDAPFAGFPVHANCYACHEEDAPPRMTDCDGCHERDGPGRNRKFLCNDIRFTHAKHVFDEQGRRLACQSCHVDIAESTDSSDLNLPLMSDCATCHDRSDRTPDRVRIDNCGLCHQDDVDSAPLPGNHTGESQGRRDEARCP